MQSVYKYFKYLEEWDDKTPETFSQQVMLNRFCAWMVIFIVIFHG